MGLDDKPGDKPFTKFVFLDPARAGYEGFAGYLNWNVDGQRLEKFEELPRQIQIAWAAAFKAAFEHFIECTQSFREVPDINDPLFLGAGAVPRR